MRDRMGALISANQADLDLRAQLESWRRFWEDLQWRSPKKAAQFVEFAELGAGRKIALSLNNFLC